MKSSSVSHSFVLFSCLRSLPSHSAEFQPQSAPNCQTSVQSAHRQLISDGTGMCPFVLLHWTHPWTHSSLPRDKQKHGFSIYTTFFQIIDAQTLLKQTTILFYMKVKKMNVGTVSLTSLVSQRLFSPVFTVCERLQSVPVCKFFTKSHQISKKDWACCLVLIRFEFAFNENTGWFRFSTNRHTGRAKLHWRKEELICEQAALAAASGLGFCHNLQ